VAQRRDSELTPLHPHAGCPEVPVILRSACARKPGSRAKGQLENRGIADRERITVNSVDPAPMTLSPRPNTCAVLPFSRQGVIRAKRVSPSLNLEPDLCILIAGLFATHPTVGSAAMSKHGALAPPFSDSRGLNSNHSPASRVSRPFGRPCHPACPEAIPRYPAAGRAAARPFRVDRAEVDEPVLEYRPCGCLGGVVHAPAELDPVVQPAENLRNCTLLAKRGSSISSCSISEGFIEGTRTSCLPQFYAGNQLHGLASEIRRRTPCMQPRVDCE